MSETEMVKPYVWLKTCDDSIQVVDREIAMVCPFICQEISEKGTGSSKSSAICLPEKVSLAMLNLILDYCLFHHIQGHSNKERKLYDEEFVRIVADNLFELAYAAYNLQLKPLIDLTCHEIARTVEIKSPKEICDIFHWLDDRAKEEMLKLIINTTCNPSRRLKRLMKNKRKEFERIQKNVEVKREEKHVVDERPIEELVSFINGSNDGETKKKKKKTCKNKKKKNRRKKKDQQKNSSMKEEEGPVVEFDDEIDHDLMTDKEVEEFARRLNCTREERIKEILRDCDNHRDE
ncbi:putative S-phase kinase-associated protein [Medicago truncatula]|uniref:Putative S-phase kinase-associated protein n=1 Tax=Medicago truncatula TaxID=3880 RepID=A0A072TKE3_MEDTR|nr:SKP1 family, dimerization domain protein [Medicago truncatula]RHN38675.1 putative S-phase kinase-associated protein [Medicago truncatula]